MFETVTVSRCLEFAIETEKLGAGLYARLAERFKDDRELRELFWGLAGDEAKHEQLFRTLLDRIPPEVRNADISFERQNYLRAMSVSEVFSDNMSVGKAAESIRTRDDALGRAMDLEKATLSYYQAVSDIIGADETIEALIAVEKSHVAKVMELMITGAKYRGLDDRG